MKNKDKEEAARASISALMTVRDLERLLQVTRRTVDRLTRRGVLPKPLKLGGSNRWRATDVVDALGRLEERVERRIEPVETN